MLLTTAVHNKVYCLVQLLVIGWQLFQCQHIRVISQENGHAINSTGKSYKSDHTVYTSLNL